jgi:hypothetical protein
MNKSLISIFLLLFTVSCSIITMTDPVEIINFKMVNVKNQRRNMTYVRLDKDGIGKFSFDQVPSGMLLFKYKEKKLYFDSDYDGKFEGVDATPIERRKPISIPLEINGETYSYKIQVPFGNPRMIYLTCLSSLEAEYKGTKINLYDKDVNGDFSDLGKDLIKVGNAPEPALLGNLTGIGTGLYDLEYENKGTTVKLKPYEGPLAKVNVKSEENRTCKMLVSHVDGKLSTEIESGKDIVLIPGEYKITRSISYVQDPENKRKRKNMLTGRGGTMIVTEDQEVINIGAPFRMEFNAVKSAKDSDSIKITSVDIIDNTGAKHRAKLYYGNEKSTLLSFIRSGQKEKQLSSMEYG